MTPAAVLAAAGAAHAPLIASVDYAPGASRLAASMIHGPERGRVAARRVAEHVMRNLDLPATALNAEPATPNPAAPACYVLGRVSALSPAVAQAAKDREASAGDEHPAQAAGDGVPSDSDQQWTRLARVIGLTDDGFLDGLIAAHLGDSARRRRLFAALGEG